MAEMTPEKMAAQEDAYNRTEWEHQRIEYYYGLRYKFSCVDVDYWLDTLYDQQKAKYKAQKDPSWNQIRKEAGIGFFENVFAFISEEKRKAIESRKAEVKKRMQAEIDDTNAANRERCYAYNSRLRERLQLKLRRLTSHEPEEVEEYFTFVLNLDSFALDGNEYSQNFNLVYNPQKKQLVIDYNLPTMDQVSQVKEWKVDKNNDVIPKLMNKTDYLEMYERVLFDLSMRAVGVLFLSDGNSVLNSVVFNGSCVYNNWQNRPTILISFEMPKSQYSYDRVSRMDCIGKAEIAKLKEVRYLDDIHSQKAPSDLWETPPSKLVVPIQSSF